MNASTLIVMAKYPVHGQVKTRLAAELGADGALCVYQQLLTRTASALKDWSGDVAIYTAGLAMDSAPPDWPLAAWPQHPQIATPNLGARLAHALNQHIHAGPVLVIGTDCPGLTTASLQEMADALTSADATADVACGPATDGGYWCLGCANAEAIAVTCAESLPWSQSHLLIDTRRACAQAGLRYAEGPTLADCDTFSDYRAAVAADLLRPVG